MWRLRSRPVWFSADFLQRLRLLEFSREIWRRSREDNITGRAAQLAYYFLLALFPLLILLSTLLGFVLNEERGLHQELLTYAASVMPWSAYRLVYGTMSEVANQASGGTLSLGLVLSLWTASSGMQAVIDCLNIVYRVPRPRSFLRRRIVALTLTLALEILISVSLLLILAGNSLDGFLVALFGADWVLKPAWSVAQYLLAMALMLLTLVTIYRYAPNLAKPKEESVLPGAVVALLGWIAASAAFRLYLAHFRSFSNTYGSLGAVIALLLWLHLTALLLLIGGEVNAALSQISRDQGDHAPSRLDR